MAFGQALVARPLVFEDVLDDVKRMRRHVWASSPNYAKLLSRKYF